MYVYRWSCDGILSVGRENEECETLMTYKDRNPFVINYIGFSTAWGATGEWTIMNGEWRVIYSNTFKNKI